jgi:hypothetical protein
MRKGRSSRRGRVSRPLIASAKPPAAEAHAGEVAPSPRRVLSVPPEGPPPAESDAPPPVAAKTLALGSSADPAPRMPSQRRAGSDPAIDEKFFSEGDLSVHLERPPTEEAITVQDKVKRKADPQVVERRARFARYVKWAVGGAGVLCLLALGRTAFVGRSNVPPPVAKIAVEPTANAEPAVKAAEPVAKPAETTEPPAASAASAEPVASATAEPVASTAPSAAPTGDAKAEKATARKSLEHGKLPLAIEAGERAVALDPTDGEAWLILGAAYQEKGALADARRAYASCVKEGKTGPRAECAKMLR